MSAERDYIAYLEERLNYVDSLYTSSQAALHIALMELNKAISDRLMQVDREIDLQLYERLNQVRGPLSHEITKKMKHLYNGA